MGTLLSAAVTMAVKLISWPPDKGLGPTASEVVVTTGETTFGTWTGMSLANSEVSPLGSVAVADSN